MSVYNLFDVTGRKALVTGAGRGIGRVLALALAEAGCDVSILEIDIKSAESTAKEIRQLERKSIASQADVTKKAVYNTSKAGVAMLSKSLAVEWAQYGIRVNSISPGYTKTEMTLSTMTHLFPAWESLTPMGRLGEPEELRGAVLYLASDASSYMTGHDLVSDGGYTAR